MRLRRTNIIGHRVFCLVFVGILAAGMTGCGQAAAPAAGAAAADTTTAVSEATSAASTSPADRALTDTRGNTFTLPENPRVVALYGSYAECWALAGGILVGVTEDAVSERGMKLSADMKTVGSVMEPSLETIVALEPDYVMMSADIKTQQDLEASFKQMGIAYGYYQMDTFEDYAAAMTQFCRVTGREDLLEQHVTAVGDHIQEILAAVPADAEKPDVLLLRAYSTGVKAKTDDNLAGVILKELGCHNIADDYPSMLEELSLETVIERNPDYIFVSTMGDEGKALAYLNGQIAQNPAWNQLTAVTEDRYIVLPKELFHYKPNERWDESYEYLEKNLYE